MPTITISNFKGMIPRTSSRLFDPNIAVLAENARLDSGMLRGFREPHHKHTVTSPTAPRRIFRLRKDDEDLWFAVRNPLTDVIQSPLVNETLGRWYVFAKNDSPKVALFDDLKAGDPPYRLRVEPPYTAPTLTDQGNGSSANIETRVYVISYVTEWGEETSTSPPSTVDVKTDSDVKLSSLYSTVNNPLEGRDWKYVRVYRTVFGRESSQLYFVDDIPWSDQTYVDSKPSSKIVFNTTFPKPNDMPPEGIHGARVHPTGSVVAFKGRSIYFSRPYMPHAWPEDWKLNVEDEVVALEISGSDILVLTTGKPVVLYGQDVSSLGIRSFPLGLPCSNNRAVVSMPEGVYYPSRDGVVLFTSSGPRFLTTGIIAQDQWYRDYFSNALVATRDDSDYIAIKPDGTGFKLTQDSSGVMVTEIVGLAGSIDFHRDMRTGQVYLMRNGEVYEWNPPAGDEITYRWISKEFYHREPVSFTVFKADFVAKPEEYDGTGAFDYTLQYLDAVDLRNELILRVWADGELAGEVKLFSNKIARIQSGYKGLVWQFELEGQCPLHNFRASYDTRGLVDG